MYIIISYDVIFSCLIHYITSYIYIYIYIYIEIC